MTDRQKKVLATLIRVLLHNEQKLTTPLLKDGEDLDLWGELTDLEIAVGDNKPDIWGS